MTANCIISTCFRILWPYFNAQVLSNFGMLGRFNHKPEFNLDILLSRAITVDKLFRMEYFKGRGLESRCQNTVITCHVRLWVAWQASYQVWQIGSTTCLKSQIIRVHLRLFSHRCIVPFGCEVLANEKELWATFACLVEYSEPVFRNISTLLAVPWWLCARIKQSGPIFIAILR